MAALSVAGVDPVEVVEAREVTVEGAYASAVFDGEGGQMGVRDEVPVQIAVDEELPEDVAVTVPRGGNPRLVCI